MIGLDNRILKTLGEALLINQFEPEFETRLEVNIEGKNAIGNAAAKLVSDGASMIIDSATTTLCLDEALIPRQSLTIYTNDLHVARKLAGRNDN